LDPRQPLHARDATPADHGAFVRFFAELGLPHDPVPNAPEWAAMCKDAFFLERGSAPVAYACVHVLDATAHVFHVVVDPAHRGAGVGRALMDEIARRLRARGIGRWYLNVKPDNHPAIRLYERLGLKATHRRDALRFHWSQLDRLPASSIAVRPIDAAGADDAVIERAFNLAGGHVALLRASGRRILFVGLDKDAMAGFASFDPTFPGAYPFRAFGPEVLRPLLEAMRLHKRPADESVRLVVEDPSVIRALLEAGAETVMEALHMEGDVPVA
jgi:ribosomal protein S18 acetylase RimI-like enzyme